MKKKKSLVIVESPTKAKTISKILGAEFSVVSSLGHLIDLPKSQLGVDVENNFEPKYIVIKGRSKVLTQLKKEGKSKDTIYVATDPDREGEAIGWQIKRRIFEDKNVLRVVFHEITSSAVKHAFEHPRDFDLKMIEAQAGRRVLDRLVGYFLSPLLWKKIARGLSAGRVQSVALRIIVEREKKIRAFIPQEYWEIEAELNKENAVFKAKLAKIEDKKAEIKDKQEAEAIEHELNSQKFIVSQVKETEKKRYPDPPFITSTLQQEAFNKLHFNAVRTMILAQELYEGIDIGEKSPVGLITYMRTDSAQVAADAIKEVRGLISKEYGNDYLPDSPNVYKAKKLAQEAHEAIRPTLIGRTAESLKDHLGPEQYKLYDLIYRRFLASQMTPARMRVTSIDIAAGKYQLSASGTRLEFPGFTVLYAKEEEENGKEELPKLHKDDSLELIKLLPSQHFTKPPARFSDSSLVKLLEEEGIGRPSTYAPIVSTLIQRDYIRRIKGYFHPTELGFKVCDLLVEYFPRVMDVKFTALMEEELDGIEEGKIDKIKLLEDFYKPFKLSVDFAQENIQKEVLATNEVCDKCGKPMVIKWGRKGRFLSCSDFPVCKNSKSITTGVKCPQPDCGGELVERRSSRGFFYGCTNYPKCTYISKTLPKQEE